MVRHIVWWMLKPEAEGRTALENAQLIKQRAESLLSMVPSLKSVEVSFTFLPSTLAPVQIILSSTHDDAAGLKAYAEHPAHVAMGKELVSLVTEHRQAIDYLF
ncbi:MAG: Dabb family protein [Bilophila sp.]